MKPSEYFTYLHDVECNQKYGNNLPYSFHLEMVYKTGLKFETVLTKALNVGSVPHDVHIALWGHDAIEDGRITYNDLKQRFSYDVAEIIYLCTDFKGRTRSERKPEQFYLELVGDKSRLNLCAVFVKLCDMISNIQYSVFTNASMAGKYKQEWPETKKKLEAVSQEFKEMFDYIDKLLLL